MFVFVVVQIIPSQMKRMVDDKGSVGDNGNGQLVVDDVAVEPVVRGYVRDWDAMEDLLNYVLYSGLGWEIGNEGQILFTDPLCTPKVFDFRSLFFICKAYFFIILFSACWKFVNCNVNLQIVLFNKAHTPPVHHDCDT